MKFEQDGIFKGQLYTRAQIKIGIIILTDDPSSFSHTGSTMTFLLVMWANEPSDHDSSILPTKASLRVNPCF